MLTLLITSLSVLGYIIFFFANRKKALLFLFLIKLPLDQIAWKTQIDLVFISFKGSEIITVLITLLFFTAFMLDKIRDPNRLGVVGYFPKVIKIPILIFMGVFFMQIFTGGSIIGELRVYIKLITGFFIGVFVAKTITNENDINWLLRCMLFGTIVMSILNIPAIYSGGQLHIYVSHEDSTIGTYLSGGVGQYFSADSFAHAFLVNAPAILLAATVLKSKWEKILCLFVMLFIIVGVFVSAMRVAWISLSLLLVIWMIIQKRWKLIIVTAACVFIVVTAQVFSSPLQRAYQKISLEVDSIEKREIPSYAFGGRPRIWKIYAEYYMNAPLIIKIIGSNELFNMAMGKAGGHDPHNDFMYILIRMGIIGLVATLYLYIASGIHLLKEMRNMKTAYGWNLALTAILALLTMLVPSFTRTGLMNPNYEWVFWSFAMLAFNYNSKLWNNYVLPETEQESEVSSLPVI